MHVTPYLNFNGDCKAAFEFYQQVLGGTIEAMFTHGETPMAEQVPPDWKDRIMHAYLRAGDLVLMASDTPPDYYAKPQGLYVSLHVETAEEADRIFNALSENGKVTMPIEETFWAARFGMLVDQYGTPWMVNCDHAN